MPTNDQVEELSMTDSKTTETDTTVSISQDVEQADNVDKREVYHIL